MVRTPLHPLNDIREAIDGIGSVIDSANFADFTPSWGMQRAVERGLEIISDASRSISDELKQTEAAIPWRQIAAIGNLLRHE